jgi:hypothetical protein
MHHVHASCKVNNVSKGSADNSFLKEVIGSHRGINAISVAVIFVMVSR